MQALLDTLRDPRFRGLVTLVAALLLTGTVFYSVAEGWGLLDSLYFSVVALLTVGFGDLVPTTAASKLFTIFYVLIGVGVLISFVSAIAQGAEGRRLPRRRSAGSTGDDGPTESR